MVGWFGKSWGAPACDPEDHEPTPQVSHCMECDKPILPDDQGIAMPVLHADYTATRGYWHLDCYLKKVLPHGPDCTHCRGHDRSWHLPGCGYGTPVGRCTCYCIVCVGSGKHVPLFDRKSVYDCASCGGSGHRSAVGD